MQDRDQACVYLHNSINCECEYKLMICEDARRSLATVLRRLLRKEMCENALLVPTMYY